MVVFKDQYKPEIPYAMDYPFASEFYPKQDCRYPLIEQYKALVNEKTGVMPYNGKIAIPDMGNQIFNVYLYFWNLSAEFTPEKREAFRLDSYLYEEDNYFMVLFREIGRAHV